MRPPACRVVLDQAQAPCAREHGAQASVCLLDGAGPRLIFGPPYPRLDVGRLNLIERRVGEVSYQQTSAHGLIGPEDLGRELPSRSVIEVALPELLERDRRRVEGRAVLLRQQCFGTGTILEDFRLLLAVLAPVDIEARARRFLDQLDERHDYRLAAYAYRFPQYIGSD